MIVVVTIQREDSKCEDREQNPFTSHRVTSPLQVAQPKLQPRVYPVPTQKCIRAIVYSSAGASVIFTHSPPYKKAA